ncbi:MAG TPA: FhaA domain-containing protein, partial [Kofleriaceae bacterium]|nr:FhaA domain-containing protein [Kofleriaceae bacterium]
MAVIREAHDRFRLRFADLERTGVLGLFRPEARDVDPYLICRAVIEVMRQASLRSPSGRLLLWNTYRVILARPDHEPLRAVVRLVHADLEAALAAEAAALGAEVVGELRVHLVADESGELAQGEAVVRVEFAPAAGRENGAPGELTVHFPGAAVAGQIENATVLPSRAPAAAGGRPCVLVWQGGRVRVPPGVVTAVGRAHAGQPERFIALAGVSPRISKQHFWLAPRAGAVAVGRFPSANPIEVAGTLVAAGAQIDVTDLPV